MYSRAKGTADHYWPQAAFFSIRELTQRSRPEGNDVSLDTGGGALISVYLSLHPFSEPLPSDSLLLGFLRLPVTLLSSLMPLNAS